MVNFEKEAKLLWQIPLIIVSVGFLAALVLPNFIGCADCGGLKTGAARAQIHMLGTALDSYKRDVETYPTTEQGLAALRLQPEGVNGWDGPYLMKDVPNDPWKHPYIYKFPGKTPGKPEIGSYGADGLPGGEGYNTDIFND